MQPLAHVVKVSLPNYLSGLPVPDSIGGWFRLSFRDWLSLIPPAAATAGLYYMAYKAFCPKARDSPSQQINPIIRKDVPKVVDTIDIEDITEKAVLCRCWRSKNWPYCDGSHGKHNKDTGDNTGPIVVAHKKS
ncbi:CDGSH iron sulfur domain 2 [Arctopsyche grandis]|uniref:CDGSH iron sulfur domain 2 n=1 Tax=Arctopsyche grandis TaxID=121162 RepID=UPI00406D7A55